jgi:hypothetical protein
MGGKMNFVLKCKKCKKCIGVAVGCHDAYYIPDVLCTECEKKELEGAKEK